MTDYPCTGKCNSLWATERTGPHLEQALQKWTFSSVKGLEPAGESQDAPRLCLSGPVRKGTNVEDLLGASYFVNYLLIPSVR